MRVIICGAGQVGSNIAAYLATGSNNITVIDVEQELITRINDQLDATGIVGHAAHPDVLKNAGAEDAEMIIAATHVDEVNMMACQVAHSLFNVPKKIARIRCQSYLDPAWANLFSREHMPIDVTISPEIEVADAIAKRVSVPGAFNVIPLAGGKVQLVGVVCHDDCPIINTPLRHLTNLFPDLMIEVVAISREDEHIIPEADDLMQAGDEVYFVTETSHLQRSMVAFGHDEPDVRRIVIIGGGNVGLYLADTIQKKAGVSAQMIEHDPDRAKSMAEQLPETTVLQGSGLDRTILEEANINKTEAVIAVTNDDETNILSSLLAKRYGCQHSIALINNRAYSPLMSSLNIDAFVSPRAITVSSILQHVRRGRIKAVHSLRDDFAEIIEAEVLDTSSIANTAIHEVDFPPDTIVGAIIRGEEVIIPRPDTVIKADDLIIILAAQAQVDKIEKMFSVSLEYF